MTSSSTPKKKQNKRRRRLIIFSLTSAAAILLATSSYACYVARSAWFQSELLLSREPVSKIRKSGELTEKQLSKLDLIDDVRVYGGEIGLKATNNYRQIAWEWDRTIWNLSASAPLEFHPKTWWFPIVGRVPYLGFFRKKDTRKWARRLDRRGWDVYLRTAGAYSTLGYFEDPILPGMLKWRDDQLANTVLHEMVHATVWIKGSVAFNESLASFVGDNASLEYLKNRHGPESQEFIAVIERREDQQTWRRLQRELYGHLRAIYANTSLTDEEKLAFKQRTFADWPKRVEAASFHKPERYLKAAQEGTWNNARLLQFRAYNSNQSDFQAVLDAVDGNYPLFLDKVNEIVRGSSKPFTALKEAVRVQDF